MNSDRKRLLVTLGGLALSAGLVFTAARAQSSTPATGAAPKLAEEQFKNIQVLKGVPADQVIPAMQFMAASLGVECDFCHVQGERGLAADKDDKKTKVTARKMMQMMFAINKENFEGHRVVTCNSCHNGSAHPAGIPAITEEANNHERDSNAEAAKPVLPSADQLLDKYLTAVGGSDALKKISSRTEKGTIKVQGQKDSTIEVFAKAPDKRVSITQTANGESFTGFDGSSGWLALGGRTRPMSAADSNSARIDADFYFPEHVKSLYAKFDVRPGEKIDSHETFLLIGHNENQPPLRLYLDSATGLLVRLVRYTESPLGLNPTQIDYADYRDADGVKVPYRWTLSRPGNSFTIQIDDLKQNVPIEDSKFSAPAAPATGH